MVCEPWQVWVPTGSSPHWQHPKQIRGVPWGTSHPGNTSSSSSLRRSPRISGTAAPTATPAPPCPPPWSRASSLWLWRQSKCHRANSVLGGVSKFSSWQAKSERRKAFVFFFSSGATWYGAKLFQIAPFWQGLMQCCCFASNLPAGVLLSCFFTSCQLRKSWGW